METRTMRLNKSIWSLLKGNGKRKGGGEERERSREGKERGREGQRERAQTCGGAHLKGKVCTCVLSPHAAPKCIT